MIFGNQLHAGERVPQDEIAASLRVSRVPVREAVIALDREGWVTNEAHRGAFVNGLDADTVRDHFELIGFVYGFAARRASERGSADGLARLGELVKEIRGTDDPDELWRLNGAFLRELLAMAQSRRIRAMARILAISIVPGKYFAEVPGVRQVHKRGIRAVHRAIKEGDGQRAEDAYAAMLRAEAESVVSLLTSRGIITS
jgi:DNA-binding GntR family transcriptional regulator